MSNYDATPGMNPPMTAPGGMNLEVWFPQSDQVTVWLESFFDDPDDDRLYETMLFALFAARQLANGSKKFVSNTSLAEGLSVLGEREPLPEVVEALETLGGGIKVGTPTTPGGRKGFTCTLRPEKRQFFKLHQHGFGLLGKGLPYYAPIATIALLAWLLARREDDDRYQLALGTTAKMIGAAGVSGQITVTSQAQVAMQASSAGWFHPDDMLPDDTELSDEVRQACEANEIEFGELYAGASTRLQEALAADQIEDGMTRIFPEEAIKRLCRFEVAAATELGMEHSPIANALQLLESAKQTGDQQQIQSAYRYYDRQLAEQLDARGLLPVAEQLEDMLFESNADEAG